MSTLKVNTVLSADTPTVNITDGLNVTGVSTVANITATTVTATNIVNSEPLSHRNKVINGGMMISQRNGTSAIQLSATEYYILDRFKSDNGSSFDMKADATQSTDHPNGFSNSLQLTCDGVSDPTTDGNGGISTFLEGLDVQDFGFGTSGAKTLTLSFYAKSATANSGDTYSVMLGYARSSDGARVKQSRSFTVTNAWQRFTMTFLPTGEAQSSAIRNTNAYGVQIYFSLAAGSNDLSSEITTWTVGAPLVGVTGQNNFFDAVGNQFFVTGVQLEVGSVATPFEHRSYADELNRCYRYYYQHVSGTDNSVATATVYQDNNLFPIITFPVRMRAEPSLDVADGSGYFTAYSNGGSDGFDTFSSIWNPSHNTAGFNAYSNDGVSGRSAGHSAMIITSNASAYLGFSAEL